MFMMLSMNIIGQKSIFLRPYTSFIRPLGNVELKEYGIGYYPFRYKKSAYFEYGITGGIQIRKWSIGIGWSYKQTRQEYGYTVYHPQDKTSIFENVEAESRFKMVGLHLGISYDISKKFTIGSKFELNNPVFSYESLPLYRSYIGVYTGTLDGELALFAIAKDEYALSMGSPYSNGYLEIRMDYQIIKHLNIYIGLQKNLLANNENYRLEIRGSNPDYPKGPGPDLNKVVITSDFFGLVIGVSGDFDIIKWGKR